MSPCNMYGHRSFPQKTCEHINIRIRDNGSIPITANPFAEFSQQTLRIVVFRNGFEFMVNRNESLA